MRTRTKTVQYTVEENKDVLWQLKYEKNMGRPPARVMLRCVNCGHFADLRNFERFHDFEEMDVWCFGSPKGKRGGGLLNRKKANPQLKQFWVVRLQRILDWLGVKPKEVEVEAKIEEQIEPRYDVERYEAFVAAQGFGFEPEFGVESYGVE